MLVRVRDSLLVAAALLCATGAFAADELTLRYFRELRARRLYSVAEQACLHGLARTNLTADERADLTIELADTLVEHACYVSDREQAEMWQRARQALRDQLQKDPQSARNILLEAHLALVPAAEGHWCRWQAELVPYEAAWAEQARKALDDALPSLLDTEKQLAALLRASRKDLPDNFPRTFELRSLLANVSFRRAQAAVDSALLPGTGAAERSAGLIQAEKLLRTLSETNEGDEILWSSRVLYIQCQRLLGETARAQRTLTGYEAEALPPEYVDSLTAEKVRLLQVAQPAEADRQLDAALNAHSLLTGELAFLKTQRLAQQVRDAAAKEPAELTNRQADMQDFVERAQTEVGGFWGYRCALVQQQLDDELKYGPEIAPVVRRAEADFRRGQIDDSLAGFAKAITQSDAAGRKEQAFDLRYMRASVAVETKQWADALDDLQQMLQEQPKHPQAPDIHLLRVYSLGKLYEEKPTQPRREDYTASLHKHRELFPKHESFGEATWMLADLEDRRKQTTVALQLYSEIPDGHPRAADARLRQARCYPRILDRLRELKRPAQAWEAEAVSKLTALLPRETSQPLNEAQLEIALILARIQLDRAEPAYAAADEILARVDGSFGDLPPSEDAARKNARQTLRAGMMRLRIVSLSSQGRPQEASLLLKQLDSIQPAELLKIAEALAPLASQVGQGALESLGELQLQAAEQLNERRAQLKPAEQRRLDQCLARAYLATGQPQRALSLYAALTKAQPDDKELLKSYAALLQESGSVENVKQALVTWETVELQEAVESPAWVECRLQIARCLLALNRPDDCRKSLDLTRDLAPKLGNAELAREFAEIEKQAAKR